MARDATSATAAELSRETDGSGGKLWVQVQDPEMRRKEFKVARLLL
jgi:hypothetical protein